MEKSEFENLEIAIIGLGLMGASCAMALKGKCGKIIGFDLDADVCSYAIENGVADKVYSTIENNIGSADIIILATPIKAILDNISKLPDMHKGNPIVMDMGSTKSDIIHAFESLPERFDVIGGHPVCGKETLSIVNADKMLFQNNQFIFSQIERTSERATKFAHLFCAAIGAIPHFVQYNEHDVCFASTSHMPFLVSTALLMSTPNDYKPMIGPGFRSMVRIANTPSSMMADVIESNRDNVVNAIEDLQENLERLKTIVSENDGNKLRNILELSRDKHAILVD